MDKIKEFEDIIKKYKAMFFDKIWEKYDDGYKLIYNIQGLNTDNTFFTVLKFVFWFNDDKSEHKNIMSYLLSPICEYSTVSLDDDMDYIIKSVFKHIKNNELTNDIIEFTMNGVENINKLLNDGEENIVNIKFIPPGNMPCIKITYNFTLETIDETYDIGIEFSKKNIELIYDFTKYKLNMFDDIYVEIVNLIYRNV